MCFPAVEGEELFDALKKGALYPKETVCFIAPEDERYSLEGRETGYD